MCRSYRISCIHIGCDDTGKFRRKGKVSCWKIFVDAEDDVIAAFTALGRDDLSENNFLVLEKFACNVFCGAKKRVDSLAEARWGLFADHLMLVKCFHQLLLPTMST